LVEGRGVGTNCKPTREQGRRVGNSGRMRLRRGGLGLVAAKGRTGAVLQGNHTLLGRWKTREEHWPDHLVTVAPHEYNEKKSPDDGNICKKKKKKQNPGKAQGVWFDLRRGGVRPVNEGAERKREKRG